MAYSIHMETIRDMNRKQYRATFDMDRRRDALRKYFFLKGSVPRDL